MPKDIKMTMAPLERIDRMLIDAKPHLPFVVWYTLRWNLLTLLYDYGRETRANERMIRK